MLGWIIAFAQLGICPRGLIPNREARSDSD